MTKKKVDIIFDDQQTAVIHNSTPERRVKSYLEPMAVQVLDVPFGQMADHIILQKGGVLLQIALYIRLR